MLTLLMPTGSSFDDSLSCYHLGTLYLSTVDRIVERGMGTANCERRQQQYCYPLIVLCARVEGSEYGVFGMAHLAQVTGRDTASFGDLCILSQPILCSFD